MKIGTLAKMVAATLALAGATALAAQELPRAARPEEVGLSAARLQRLSDRMKLGVDKGEIPGAVVLVGLNGAGPIGALMVPECLESHLTA